MLTLNYRYRIYPNKQQEETLTEILEICRSAYNYALRGRMSLFSAMAEYQKPV
nr:helix-turn-helix domain-containing protein [Halothece sp. PCC 7418]